MDFQAISAPLLDWSGSGLAIGLFEGEVALPGKLAALNDRLGGAIAELIEETGFKGKAGSAEAMRLAGAPIRKLQLIGLGKPAALTLDGVRQAAASAAKFARRHRCTDLGLSLPLAIADEAATTRAIVEGIELSLYRDRRFKSKKKDEEERPNLTTVQILPFRGAIAPDPDTLAAAIALGQQVVSGVVLARELVAAPANVVTPVTLAQLATELAEDYGLDLEILEQEQCEALGMGAFLGVAQASDLPPKFIHLTYRPEGEPRKKLAIIGKGLTFDSGGLNVKAGPGSSIEMMKTDMGGAGATFGAAKAIAQIRPDVEVHFISAATENMISGRAMHPGDILTASNGKTIEVNNTDAEGRLTLADALVFADKLGVDAMVDLATLTGACVVALGGKIAGLWSSDEALGTALQRAGESAGEKFWPMPLEEDYASGLKSVVADMKNTGPRGGGAITAALFLKKFVDKTPWAHLDVAGPVWTDKESGIDPAGATGFGVRTLVNWVLS
jgi:leucyl aminopeptidase